MTKNPHVHEQDMVKSHSSELALTVSTNSQDCDYLDELKGRIPQMAGTPLTQELAIMATRKGEDSAQAQEMGGGERQDERERSGESEARDRVLYEAFDCR